MPATRFFEWFQLTALLCLGVLGIGRAVVLYARGVHVLAIDWERSLLEGLADLVTLVLFFWWIYETVAYSWPLPKHIAPAPLGALLVDSVGVKIIGALVVLAGLLIFASALWAFADSWRIGIDRETPGALVTSGIFAWTRNPIYIAFDLLISGTFLVLGRAIFLALAVPVVFLLHYQIRREERHLAAAYGDAYREYCARVGRYYPLRNSAQRASPG